MTSKRLLEPSTKALLDAANIIEARGWWNGKEARGKLVCAEMAINAAATYSYPNMALFELAYQRLEDHLGPACPSGIADWNDANDQATVTAALRAAAIS